MGFFIGLAGEVSRRNIGTFDHSPIIGDDLDKLHSAALDAINQLRRLHASDGTKPVEVVFAYAAPAVCDVEHLKFLLEMRFDVAQELVKDDGQDAFMLEWEAALEGAVRPAMHPTTKLTTPTGVPPFLFIEQLQHSLQESGVRIIEVEGRLSSCAGLLVEQLNARYVLSNDTDLLLTPGVNVVLLHPILPDESSATPPATDPHSVWNVLLPRKTLFGKNVAAPTREVRVFFSNKLLGVLGVTFDELHRVASLCRNSISDRLSIEDAVAQVKRGQADGEGAHRPDPETRVQLFYDTHGREIPAEKLALLRSGRFESPLVPTPEGDTRCFLYTISTFRRLKHVEAYLLGRSDVTFVFDEDDTQEVDAGLSGLPRWDATLPAITDKAVAAKTISRVFNVNEDVATKLFDKENSNKLPPAVLLVLWAMCDACDDMEEIWRITEMLVLVYLASNPNAGASAAAKEIAEQTKPTSNSSQGLLASAKLAHLFATAYWDTVLKLPQPADLFSASVLLGVHQSTFTERNGIALNDVIYNTIKWHIDEFIDLIPEEMLNFIVAKGEAGAEVAAPPPSAKQKQSSKQVSRSKAKHDDGTWTVVNSQAKRSERIRQSAPSAMMGVAQRVAAAYRLGCKMIVTHSFRGGTRILAEKIGQALNNPAKVGYLLGDPRGKSGQREKRTSESTAICVTPTGFFTTVLQYFPCLPRYMKHRASITNVIIVAPSAAEWTPQHERRTGEIFDAAGVERW
ncbi:Hypothetical protein, putative [Bodo saltans]|uniref:Uncharacterized protein n=1 Tax=Bodo saltans TaxID=75058 RepID=A0A0S4J9R9_BODSA|nr:Hypothetical protein, putative [Bodo saltans]|eukprot:CUG86679.1 Hypothetical protein, putative [Bodo saltans]